MPDTSTEVAIATTTLGSAAASITFSGISGSYTDIVLSLTISTTGGAGCLLRFNSDSGSNYSVTYLRGNGSATESGRYSSWDNIPAIGTFGLSSTIPSFFRCDFFNYSGSTNKTVLVEASTDFNGSGSVIRNVGLWRNTSAITSISIIAGAGNISAGTTATLYGIL